MMTTPSWERPITSRKLEWSLHSNCNVWLVSCQNYDYDDNTVLGTANYIYKGSARRTGGTVVPLASIGRGSIGKKHWTQIRMDKWMIPVTL